MLDFTKPIETCEEPPRPVKVEFIHPICPWVVLSCGGLFSVIRRDDFLLYLTNYFIRLRNVPPKPRERWVNWYEGHYCGAFDTRELADAAAAANEDTRIACRKITEGFDD